MGIDSSYALNFMQQDGNREENPQSWALGVVGGNGIGGNQLLSQCLFVLCIDNDNIRPERILVILNAF